MELIQIGCMLYNTFENTLCWRKVELAEAGKLAWLKMARSGRKQPYGPVRFVQRKQGKQVPDLWRLEYKYNVVG